MKILAQESSWLGKTVREAKESTPAVDRIVAVTEAEAKMKPIAKGASARDSRRSSGAAT